MTQDDISYILALIDLWVSELEDNQLNEQCRRSGASFFQFMVSQGVYQGYLVKLITECLGYNPRQLWTIDDAQMLREAIARYEGAEALARKDDRPGSALRWTNAMWGQSNAPF